jgi:hypothetical protein
MKQQEQTNKLRGDLTPEQREKAERIGRIQFKSAKPAWDPGAVKFIPSRTQH